MDDIAMLNEDDIDITENQLKICDKGKHDNTTMLCLNGKWVSDCLANNHKYFEEVDNVK